MLVISLANIPSHCLSTADIGRIEGIVRVYTYIYMYVCERGAHSATGQFPRFQVVSHPPAANDDATWQCVFRLPLKKKNQIKYEKSGPYMVDTMYM